MLNDADGHGGGNAGEQINDAEALFRRLKLDVKADYNSKDKSIGAARRGKTSTLRPANIWTKTTRRFWRMQSARSSFSTG